ncbi:MFS general substrate transporter [Mycena pura]|uniref:MFS general substrate transporter n=1 Tax=Mycena pura TaxID=153505 RepID=A0AAD6VMI8_9AGAR|nr:MFS general substrate transporter [Mycena pura]
MEPAESGNADILDEKPATFEVPDGGLQAWCSVAGAWLVLFATFGSDFYTRVYLPDFSPSSISWIGSVQLMTPFISGPIVGKIFDDGGFRKLEIVGGVIFTFSVFMLSLAKPGQYYQIFLAQGVGMGLGLGCTLMPSMNLMVHHFKRHRGLAAGIALTGSSVGATIFPIKETPRRRTSNPSSFMRRTCGLSLGGCPSGLEYIHLLMHVCSSGFFGFLGLYFPVIYIQLFSVQHQVDSTLAFYSLAILNGFGGFVRILASHFADKYGPINVQTVCAFATGVLIFAILGIHDGPSLVVVSLLYGGFFSAYVSLSWASFVSLAKGPEEVGARAGLAMLMIGISTLVSAPAQGALLSDDFHWVKPVAFSGSMMVVSAIFFFIARTMQSRTTGKWRA